MATLYTDDLVSMVESEKGCKIRIIKEKKISQQSRGVS